METRHDDTGWRLAIWGGAGLLLLLPWVAMRFTTEVNWDGRDFMVIGGMLAIACLAAETALRASGQLVYRIAFGIAIATAFVTVWANLAVGMIGSEANPVNLLFGAVLVVAALGALLARLEARGMATAMTAAALAQVIATLAAVLLAGWDRAFLLAMGFALPWLVSAALFRRAARRQ